jgi:hypothetical protein
VTAPPEVALRTSLLGVVAVIALVGSFGWASRTDDVSADGDPVVLVSGRDDHGMPVADELPLHDGPAGATVGAIAADTLVAVRETRGAWLRVSSIEGESAHGWIDEFLVRGELHLVQPEAPACPVTTSRGELSPSARVRVVDVHETGLGTLEVGVESVRGDDEHHVDRAWIRELPGPVPVDGGSCAEVADVPAPAHEH